MPVERGPRDLRRLPEFFGHAAAAGRLRRARHPDRRRDQSLPAAALAEILAQAERLAADGADLIDVGCDPGGPWSGVGETVRRCATPGIACRSTASIRAKSSRRCGRGGVGAVGQLARIARRPSIGAAKWSSCPTCPRDLGGLDETVELSGRREVRLRIDPVLEPIGWGLPPAWRRYFEVRRRFPDAEMLMGVGNLTELTDVDSAGRQRAAAGDLRGTGHSQRADDAGDQLGRGSVRECDLARRLVYHAVRHRTLPKHVEPRLVMLRGAEPAAFGDDELNRLAAEIKDHNYRIFAEDGQVHVVSAGLHLADADPFVALRAIAGQRGRGTSTRAMPFI